MSRKAAKKIAAAKAVGQQRLGGWLSRKISAAFNRPAVDTSRCVQAESVKPKRVATDPRWDGDDLEQLQLPMALEEQLRRLGMNCRKLARLDMLGQLDTLPGIDQAAVSAAVAAWLDEATTATAR
jgi:hypothetical protein